MLVLREAQYVAAPWKNGGGVTREILREPHGSTDFDWRLSLATIDAPGPFSKFSGYDRALVLVRGAGVELSFEQHGARLTEIGQLLNFDGDCAVRCTLIDGPSTDLNFMVRRERLCWFSHCQRVTAAQPIQTAPWLHTYVCCISGSIRLMGITAAAELRAADTAACRQTDGVLTCLPTAGHAAIVFVAGVTRR